MEFTRTKAHEYYDKMQSAVNRFKRFRDENEARIDGVVRVVETSAAAGAISWANGRYGRGGQPMKVFGFDSDLVAGGALILAALFDAGGKYNEHLYNLGTGAFAAFVTREGLTLGYEAQLKNAPAAQQIGTGVRPASDWQGQGQHQYQPAAA